VGWFVLTSICGFLAYRCWQTLSGWFERAYPNSREPARFLFAAVEFGIVLAALALWVMWSKRAATFDEIVDALGQGTVARFMLGLVLGVGAAFVTEDRLRARAYHDGAVGSAAQPTTAPAASPAADQAAPTTASAGGADTGASERVGRDAKGRDAKERSSSGLGTHFVLSVALGITLLALAAPHIDRWLGNLTTLKSPLIEFQLTAATTHKISVAENAERLFNNQSLELLKEYQYEIQQDTEFLEKFGQEIPNHDTILASTKKCTPRSLRSSRLLRAVSKQRSRITGSASIAPGKWSGRQLISLSKLYLEKRF
jgi:hypothetical protein